MMIDTTAIGTMTADLPEFAEAVHMYQRMVFSIAYHFLHDRASARFLLEMLIALRGDEKRAAQYPIFYPFLEPISPLRFSRNGVDLLYETARLNLPVPVGPMAPQTKHEWFLQAPSTARRAI